MMRETSLDEHAAIDASEKSLTIGSVSLNHHRAANELQRDIGSNTTNDDNNNTNNNNSQIEEGRDEEEKKQEETPAKRLMEAGKKNLLKEAKTVMRKRPTTPQPPQDYLRHVTTSSVSKRAGTSWWERVVVQRSSYVVEDLVEQYTADSQFLQSDPFPVAWLDRIEVATGALLGAGTYSNVYRVQGLELLPEFLKDHQEQDRLRKDLLPSKSKPTAAAPTTTGSQDDSMQSVPATTTSTGYAIKHLKAELLQNSKLFEAAAADLIMEAKFLSRLSHPNILRLQGMALGGSTTFSATGLFDSFFLVVDELEETLIQRIHRWKVQGSTDQYQPAMILYKLKLAVQVASALAYLHERRLVFRDLKPHNIGLKHDGTIQLFDFGFCRELPSPSNAISKRSRARKGGGETAQHLPPESPPSASTEEDDEDKLYCMSGKGTLLYMSSEVLSSRCYNAKADVYSWSMVTYELLTLQKPFQVGSIEQHKKAVCDRAQRPPLHHLRWLSSGVKQLLQHSWQADVQARWHMRDVKDALDGIINELESTRRTFSRDGSKEGSFGYANPGAFLCQGMEMDSIILDITNTVQTRYEYITNKLFCQASTEDVVSTNATAPEPSVRNPNADASVTLAPKPQPPPPVLHAIKEEPRKPASQDSIACESDKNAVAPSPKGVVAGRGSEEEKDTFMSAVSNNFSMNMSTSFWGSASPRMPETSEQFPMTSLCMHSVRLSAARNRPRVTAGTISHSMNDVRPSMLHASTNARSPPRSSRTSISTLRQSADYGSGRIPKRTSMPSSFGQRSEYGSGSSRSQTRQERNASMSALGMTSELGESIETSEEGLDIGSPSCMLQTIKSEDDEKSMDDVSLEGEGKKSQDVAPGETHEVGSISIHLPASDTQYHSANEESPLKASTENEEAQLDNTESVPSDESPLLEKKKKGNPQDDQASHSGQFIPATASV